MKLSSIRPESACVVHQPKPDRQLTRRQPPRQLEQRQRIPPRLGDDPLPHPVIQHEPHRRAQQRPRVAVAQTPHLQLGDRAELSPGSRAANTIPTRSANRRRATNAKRQRRRLIQPLRVIDHTQQRTLLRHLRQQTQHPQPNEEPIRRGPSLSPNTTRSASTLRSREPLEPVKQRRAQLMQAGIRQLHLRLHPHRPQHRHVRRRLDQILQQRRLPSPASPRSTPTICSRPGGRQPPTLQQPALVPARPRRPICRPGPRTRPSIGEH